MEKDGSGGRDKKKDDAKKDDKKKDEAKPSKSEKDKKKDLSGIDHPGKNDVMFGRGGDTNYHVGNHGFRTLAEGYTQRYHEASRKEKALIVQELVNSWRNRDPPGRFLARTDPHLGDASLWHDVGTDAALKKAAKILSELSSEIRAEKKRKAKAAAALPPQKKPPPNQSQHPRTSQQQRQDLKQPAYNQVAVSAVAAAAVAAGGAAAAPLVGLGAVLGQEDAFSFPALASGQHPGDGLFDFQGHQPDGDDDDDRKMPAVPTGDLAGALDSTARQDVGTETPAGNSNRGGGVELAPGEQRREGAEDDSPESIEKDSTEERGENYPSAASLAGVFSGSSGSSSLPTNKSDSSDDTPPERIA
ncbi:expressed unknown protein [Seminavis robusta]|uniref:DUF6824 domain-containing protein n=1 Tax=Seminavis robusta TaxID=568900 RepID=A0A9N8EN97_9STRA|nr:expressed unknown protein [Seminavis robusta]|eukprot:Sro1377_g267560.1 n/a (359) ;mRNA; r:18891-20256